MLKSLEHTLDYYYEGSLNYIPRIFINAPQILLDFIRRRTYDDIFEMTCDEPITIKSIILYIYCICCTNDFYI